MADARTLCLEQELRDGIYTCCQIASWADEQWLAWTEAAELDNKPVDEVTKQREDESTERVLVPVRLRKPQQVSKLSLRSAADFDRR
jgi:hypothetical protein